VWKQFFPLTDLDKPRPTPGLFSFWDPIEKHHPGDEAKDANRGEHKHVDDDNGKAARPVHVGPKAKLAASMIASAIASETMTR